MQVLVGKISLMVLEHDLETGKHYCRVLDGTSG